MRNFKAQVISTNPIPAYNWPIDDNLKDLGPTSSHLEGCARFTSDQNNITYSAISFIEEDQLVQNFLKAPPGVYFKGDFSVTVWVKLNKITRWATLFDFSNGQEKSNIYMSLTHESRTNVYLYLKENNDIFHESHSNSELRLGVWTHVSITLSGFDLTYYLNGNIDNTDVICENCRPLNVQRSKNFLGWSSYENDCFWYSLKLLDFSDFRIYDVALTANEIAKIAKI